MKISVDCLMEMIEIFCTRARNSKEISVFVVCPVCGHFSLWGMLCGASLFWANGRRSDSQSCGGGPDRGSQEIAADTRKYCSHQCPGTCESFLFFPPFLTAPIQRVV
jgi:hypothetical protein